MAGWESWFCAKLLHAQSHAKCHWCLDGCTRNTSAQQLEWNDDVRFIANTCEPTAMFITQWFGRNNTCPVNCDWLLLKHITYRSRAINEARDADVKHWNWILFLFFLSLPLSPFFFSHHMLSIKSTEKSQLMNLSVAACWSQLWTLLMVRRLSLALAHKMMHLWAQYKAKMDIQLRV